ncbi:hypothetical protein PQR33_22640 [Paraburkholderia sediminicola]
MSDTARDMMLYDAQKKSAGAAYPIARLDKVHRVIGTRDRLKIIAVAL